MKELLGKFSGVLGTDRYGAYNSIEKHGASGNRVAGIMRAA
jgi:hypothetical protein